MQTGNPVLSDKTFGRVIDTGARGMTIEGTANKTLMLLAICIATTAWTWGRFEAAQSAGAVSSLLWVGLIGGLVCAVATTFRPQWSPVTAPAYAALEGLALGGISAMFDARYPGIVVQAVGLTFGTLVCLLGLYKAGIIKVTEKFRTGVLAATGAVLLLYLVQMVMQLFGSSGIGFIHQGGTVGILFSVFVVSIAALNLVLDFDMIESGARAGAPKFMEWYGAFGLMVTLVWLYLEILRLLGKSRQ